MVSTVSFAEAGQTPLEDLTYEQAFSELESIVGILESDQRTLVEILTMFERGQRLARYCAELLDRADLRVQQLSGEGFEDFTAQD